MTRRSPPGLFPWVQVLRAAAAAAVAGLHTAHDAVTAGHDPAGWIAAAAGFMPWTAGVDIFFVISGFVIIHASADLFATPDGWLAFLRRRLTRVVPLYWILTTCLLLVTALDRSSVHGTLGDPWYILASYLFIPVARPDGLIQPALSLGWTLNYEMFFYGLMTPFLLLPQAWAVAAGSAVLLALVLAVPGFALQSVALTFYANPMVLEFAAGMILALVVRHGPELPAGLRLLLVAAALLWLRVDALLGVNADLFHIGPPAALLVLAAVSGRNAPVGGRAWRLGLLLGDASYAMYLVHPFVMRAMTLLTRHADRLGEAGGIGGVILSLGIAQAAAVAIHLRIERPLMRQLRRRI